MTTRTETMERSQHGDVSIFHPCDTAFNLVPGQAYAFRIKPWETPLGEVIPGEVKVRVYLEFGLVGGLAFFKVQKAENVIHLIAEEVVEEIVVAGDVDDGLGF